MRSALCVWIFSLLLLPFSVRAQQTAVTTAQGSLILQRAFSALAGSTSIADLTLTGSARRIVGSDDETGTVVLKAVATGQSRMDCTFPSGQRSEVRSIASDGSPVGAWIGPDGASHAMAQHNLMTPSDWFLPALALSQVVSSTNHTVSYVGPEIKEGISVTHLAVSQQFTDASAEFAAQEQHLSQMDLFLDPMTLLPAALDFYTHPDNNMLLDIPVEIRFSDYRTVSGIQVPFHVQKYLNNTLLLDIQIQTASVNSGLSASAFAIQ